MLIDKCMLLGWTFWATVACLTIPNDNFRIENHSVGRDL